MFAENVWFTIFLIKLLQSGLCENCRCCHIIDHMKLALFVIELSQIMKCGTVKTRVEGTQK